MFDFPIGLIVRVIAVAAFAALCWWAWHAFTGHYEHIGEQRIQTKWDADVKRRTEMTTAITNLWDTKRIAADKAAQELDHERSQHLADNILRARALPAVVAGARFDGRAVSVLDDAGGSAAKVAGPAGKPDAAAAGPAEDSTVGAVTEWGVSVIGLYETCRDTVTGWRAFYSSLLATQPKEQAK